MRSEIKWFAQGDNFWRAEPGIKPRQPGSRIHAHNCCITYPSIHGSIVGCVNWSTGIEETLLRWLSHKESTSQYRRCRFNSWVRKIPWNRKWQPLQYSCLENSMDRGSWRVHGITKSQTWLSNWAHIYTLP